MLTLYNTLHRREEKFEPLDPEHIRVYVCGPTVYNYAHIGNARPAAVFDTLVRLLRHLYPRVTYVSNITDIDDKIIEAANRSGEAIETTTQRYTTIYNRDMAALNIAAPDVQPLATEHVPQMIAMIRDLLESGYAYEAEGHVLFNVPSFSQYGALSGRNRDEQIEGARVEVAPDKRDAADFVLWKPSTPDQPGWESPWGRGRPGWHIECSAMSAKHLGIPFDIHGGGIDLTFPHHENEIAQSVCAHPDHTGEKPEAFARVWVHNGFVMVEGQKMAKSLGNVLLVHHLLDTCPGEAIRLNLLSAHYRKPLDWTEEGVRQARRTLDRFYGALREWRHIAPDPDATPPPRFLEALCDDLNTPQALAELHALLRSNADPAQIKGQILASGSLMGLLQQDPESWFQAGSGISQDEIEAKISARNAARKERDFARADAIRDELAKAGIVLEDTAKGTEWKRG